LSSPAPADPSASDEWGKWIAIADELGQRGRTIDVADLEREPERSAMDGRDARAGAQRLPTLPARAQASDRDHRDPHLPCAGEPILVRDPQVRIAGRETASRVVDQEPFPSAR